MDIELRPAVNDARDAAAFCALSNSLYAREVTPAYFAWQFFACPHAPRLVTAWRSDTLVGAYGVHAIAADAHRPGRAMMLDIMISAAEQGRGLVRALAEAAMAYARGQGACVTGVVGNDRSLRAHERHCGWAPWDTLCDWEVDPAGIAADGLEARPLERPDFAAMTPSWTSYYPRDAATLAWRTLDNQRYKYEWLEVAGPGGSSLGHAAVKTFVDPASGAKFADVVAALPHEPARYARIIAAATRAFGQSGYKAVTTYPATAAETEALGSLGFKASSRRRYWSGEGPRPQGLDIAMLDVDVF